MFIRCYRRCCICSANYCKFCLISLLVLLVDVRALFLVMWPLSWYQFCVSLPQEVMTVGLVLFLQVLTLLSVLHCLPPAGRVESVFSNSVFSAAVRRPTPLSPSLSIFPELFHKKQVTYNTPSSLRSRLCVSVCVSVLFTSLPGLPLLTKVRRGRV